MNVHNISPPIVGILGGGQLGMYFTLAAQRAGCRVYLIDPSANCPARRYADQFLCSTFDDPHVPHFLSPCQGITIDQENIPITTLQSLEKNHQRVQPHAQHLRIMQDRLLEKQFLRDHAIPTTDFLNMAQCEDERQWIRYIPGIWKTRHGGYDGKGQAPIRTVEDLENINDVRHLGIIEKVVDIQEEISVVAARSPSGEVVCLPVSSNRHESGILRESYVTNKHPLTEQAHEMTRRVIHAFDYYGVLCVEFFYTAQDQLLVNEIAPRPHNSGHYSQDALSISQYDYQLRCLLNWPLPMPRYLSDSLMINIMGDLWNPMSPHLSQLLKIPELRLYLYGKQIARNKRKMGHCVLLSQQERFPILCHHVYNTLNIR